MALPTAYNLTVFSNTTGYVPLFQYINSELMMGFLGAAILIFFFGTTMMYFMRETGKPGASFTASMFIVFVLAMLLRIMGLVHDWAVYGSIALMAIGVALLKPEK